MGRFLLESSEHAYIQQTYDKNKLLHWIYQGPAIWTGNDFSENKKSSLQTHSRAHIKHAAESGEMTMMRDSKENENTNNKDDDDDGDNSNKIF